jgi:subtilase family protein
MKRKLALLMHPMALRLALLLLFLVPASCSKDQIPVGPNHVALNSKGALSAGPTPVAPDQGVLAVTSLNSIGSFCSANHLVLVSTLPMPAAGLYGQMYYCLVRTDDGSSFANKNKAGWSSQLSWWSNNSDVRLSDKDIIQPDRDGLTFDDHHTWSSATEYLGQPAFDQVRLTQARSVSQGAGVVIATLDTGVEQTHPLFQSSPAASFAAGGNYTTMPPTGGTPDVATSSEDDDNDGYANDGVGHGTAVAGLLYTGARQATIRVYKVLDDEGRGTIFGLAKAMRAAALANVNIISLSLGFLDEDPLDGVEGNDMVHHVIQGAAAQGIVIVASAGNLNSTTLEYPAAYDEVVSVTAVDNGDVRCPFSSYGPTVDVAAPGQEVVSAVCSFWAPLQYVKISGTSAAVPWVSAAIAVTKAARSCTAAQASDFVTGEDYVVNIDALNPGYDLGSGRVDMAAAAGYVGTKP